ncbi:MAG TPA: hypothetical protein DCQ64_01380 [Candidatus Rokubacteria bacterium]|nr:hypothetical protein [Candidatus Rokubacteria bacterium]
MRTLRVKQVSTGKWCQMIQTGAARDVTDAMVKGNAARLFAIADTDLAVVETEWSESERQTAISEMASGTHEGQAVIAQPAPPPYDPMKDQTKLIKAFAIWTRVKVNELRALHSLSAITGAQQRDEITTILNGL